MGTYIPLGRRNRSVQDTLVEAEEEHYLDCPTADFWIRAGAVLLDGILLFLLNSAILHIAGMLVTYIIADPSSPAEVLKVRALVSYCILVVRLMLLYFYILWGTSQWGGTPAKLLLGLRVLDVETGRRLGLPRTAFREIAGKGLGVLTLGAGFLLPFFRPDGRALHDLVSQSVVKRVREET